MKKSALIIAVLLVILVLAVSAYFFTRGTNNASSPSSIITTSSIGAGTTRVQKTLLDGGGSNSSYTSKSEFEDIFGSGSYSVSLCNQTEYQTTNITLASLCQPIFSTFGKIYGKNLTIWIVNYSNVNSHISETVILNKTGAKSGVGVYISSNTPTKINNATYSIITIKSSKNGVLSVILVSKNKETAQIISFINSTHSTAQNEALIATVSNDLT